MEQIDPVIRIHHKKIKEAFFNMDRILIEKYLGSDDVLGIQEIAMLPIRFPIIGVFKLDKYEYQIRLAIKE